MFDNLAICVQLHEHVEIIYVVDGYEAAIYTGDHPGRKVLEARGDCITSALAELNKLCAGKTWQDIRKMETIT